FLSFLSHDLPPPLHLHSLPTRRSSDLYPWAAVGVLAFGLVAETVSLRACLAEVNKVRGGRTLWRWFRETRQSELVVIKGLLIGQDRKSTRLNSSHLGISYAVFCLKKKS